ncbi:hypothetical protein Dsin_008332 [Dipteronia sinensis]|uniref:Protein kinase domain-containing protein n=1 Tax=Dipteronia sinensis TaxID=43782 RepID=A0AAE0APQ3_9ROSI|nr:hypothetical protein Dsin_008332 [Dipteronia sinensis]
MRLRIATEIASAISYLHSEACVPIVHRDIKSDNILLGEKFRAKLSDCGTSKSVALDKTHLTTQVKGTFVYFDPEYFRSSQLTEIGVVLVELLTGKKPICSIGLSQEKIRLAAYFISSLEEKDEVVDDILDARVVKEDRKEEVKEVAYLAKRCLELNGRNRPTMREVAMELEGIMISKGYLMNERIRKKVEFNVKNAFEDCECSSISTAVFSDVCINSSKEDVYPLKFNTV